MNNHMEIQKRLSAYCDGVMDSAERLRLEAHLASCPHCRAELADMKTTIHLIKSTPEVEPPTWMKSRIMAHLREEQGVKRSWLQRVWFPLHTGYPAKILTLLVVCVSGYYLSRSVDTELKLASRQQLQEIPALQAPAAIRAPEMETSAPEKRKAPESSTSQPALQRRELPSNQTAPSIPADSASLPAALQPASAPSSTPVPTPYAPSPPALRDQYSGKSESMKSAPAAESSNLLPESNQELKKKTGRSIGFSAENAAPAARDRAYGPPAGEVLPQTILRLNIHDSSNAPSLVRDAVIRSGGKIKEDLSATRHRITVRIPTERHGELLDSLQRLGKITERPAPPSPGPAFTEIIIQW
jgi:hypothetical protein